MDVLTGKRILLGITGSIAAYKSAELVRALRDGGAEVRVVMTQAAQRFVGRPTLQALTGHTVATDPWAQPDAGMEHIDLARWADAVLVAPASADFLARLAHGRADDLLASLCLAADVPIAIAPAMNRAMWANPATCYNLALLKGRGIHVFGPDHGEQACGEVGAGRMRDPALLRTDLGGLFVHGLLSGLSVMVTAGPTWEPLDPVRMLANRSSGKMGFALARAALEAGARVRLVTGPVALETDSRIECQRVTTAEEMWAAVQEQLPVDIFIGAAAVADYRPLQASPEKIKKHAEQITLTLVRTPDIVAQVACTTPRPFTVGFAAETSNLIANARQKLAEKHLDLIAANVVGVAGTGFDAEDNELVLIDAADDQALPRMSKDQLARRLIAEIGARYRQASPDGKERR